MPPRLALGLREPIILYEGAILDGRNRARACAELDIEPLTRQWRGEGISPTAYVASMNLHRRHLSPAERAIFAVQISVKSNAGRPKRDIGPNGPISRRQAARLVGVDDATVRRAAARLAETPAPEAGNDPLGPIAKRTQEGIVAFTMPILAQIAKVKARERAAKTRQAVRETLMNYASLAQSAALRGTVGPLARPSPLLDRQ